MATKEIFFNAFIDQHFQHFNIEKEALTSLKTYFHKKSYLGKTPLLQAGDRWEKVYYLQQGLIRLYYTDNEGREFNKAFFSENHFIWPVAPRDRHEKSLFSIVAIEDTTVLECSFLQLHKWLEDQGCWEKFALPFAEALVEQKFLREHDFLLLSATERFQKFSQNYPNIVSRLPDYHLASYLGITNVSLSRIKNR